MDSTRTKLEVFNSVLRACGERPQTTTSGTLGTMVADMLNTARIQVCSQACWEELKYVENADSWATDVATLSDTVYRVRNLYYYQSPDGSPEASYDYARISIPFCTLEEYLHYPLLPYTDDEAFPLRWTFQGRNQVRANPYPNDATERLKITFEVFKYPELPASDSSTWGCSDDFLNLIQHKTCELVAAGHLNDFQLAQYYAAAYRELKGSLLISDGGLQTGGYTLYRGRRGRRW